MKRRHFDTPPQTYSKHLSGNRKGLPLQEMPSWLKCSIKKYGGSFTGNQYKLMYNNL